MKKYILLILAFAIGSVHLTAQELGLHFMDKTFNSNLTNPANLTDFKVNIGLFSGYTNFSNGFSYRDAVTNRNGVNTLDLDMVINGIGSQNELITDHSAQTLSIAFAVKDWNFSLHHNIRNSNQVMLPRNLLEFAWRGNGSFVGETIDIAPSFDILAFNEIGLGVARKFNNLTLGLRFKKLNGIANFHTASSTLAIHTSESTFDVDIQSDLMINGAAAVDFGGFENLDFDLDNLDIQSLLRMNRGFGFDIGANLQVNNKLELSLSILDIGSINWTDNTYNYHSNGSFLWSGIDAAEALSGDDDPFSETVSNLEEEIAFEQTTNGFTTQLPSRVYLSGQYRVSQLFGIGALFFGEQRVVTNEFVTGLALNGSLYLGNKTSLGATVAMRNGDLGNLGVHASTMLGPIQIFMVSDNVMPALDPLNSRNVNVRFGMNLAFGQRWQSMTKKKLAKYSEKHPDKVMSAEEIKAQEEKRKKKKELKRRLRNEDIGTN